MPQEQPKGFDVAGARKAGYSDKEIRTHLSKYYDVDGATKAGYTLEEIGLAIKPSPKQEPAPPSTGQYSGNWDDALNGVLGKINAPIRGALSLMGEGASALATGRGPQATQGTNPVAGVAKMATGAAGVLASPFTGATELVRQMPVVGPSVASATELPFAAVPAAAGAIESGLNRVGVPKNVQNLGLDPANAEALARLLETGSMFGVAGGMGAAIPKIGPKPLPDMSRAKSTGAYSERAIPSSDAIPVAFRAAMIKKLVKAGENPDVLNKLPDDALAKIYKAQGLDPQAPLSEAPVSRGGDMSVRGPANEAQITAQTSKSVPKKVEALANRPPEAIQNMDEAISYAFNINKERLNISPEAKIELDQVVNAIRPELEKAKGKTLSNAEVLEAAQTSDVLQRTITREDTKQLASAILKTRQAVAAGAEGRGVSGDFINNLRFLSSWAADAGRTLQSFNIKADPTLGTVKERIVQRILDAGAKAEDIIKAAEGVDFTNAQEAATFYRQFVKPSAKELMTEFRYINILSSPLTHIRNAFSNIIQGGLVGPATKLAHGALDRVGATISGRERQVYAKSVGPYYKGLVNAMPQAAGEALKVLRGEKFALRPDLEFVPSMGEAANPMMKPVAKFNEFFRIVPNALEAADIFGQTLIKQAQKNALAYSAERRGIKIPDAVLDAQAEGYAKELLFRKELDPTNLTGHGTLLSAIDKMTAKVYGLREAPLVGWVVPFVRTPMNILKQGIEYSPAGALTAIGAKDVPLQLAKTFVGSTVAAGAAAVVMSNESTWEAPTNAKEKEEFYAQGKQPYSVKLGDTWYSYSKLGVLAYPIALAAAYKYHTEQSKQSRDTNAIEKFQNILASQAKFFADQSYVQGLGDLIDAAQSGEADEVNKFITGLASQGIPLSSLQNWVGNILDPVYRKPKGIVEGLASRTPFTREFVPATADRSRTPILGIPPELLNAFSPVGMSKDVSGAVPYKPKKTGVSAIDNY